MLHIYVLDTTAESRAKLLDRLHRYLDIEAKEIELIPRVNLKPIAREELQFHAAPDVCVLGPELVTGELTEIGKIRKVLPHTPLLVCTTPEIEGLAAIEQMARLGADDTLFSEAGPLEFLRKLVLLSRKAKPRESGKLVVVDSGKGGVGVTSISAALAESVAAQGNKTLLIDFDVETQDLSRFLQTRPFVNENLQLLFDCSRPLNQEYIEQCFVQVWEDEPNLYCMPPLAESDSLYAIGSNYPRTLLSILEFLDEMFDCIIVDAGGIRGALQKSLYRVADKVLFVLNNDPATLYGSVDKIGKVRDLLSPNASLVALENGSTGGLPRKILVEEFSRAARLNEENWFQESVIFSKQGTRWPGSGETLATSSKQGLSKVFRSLAEKLELCEPEQVRGAQAVRHTLLKVGGLIRQNRAKARQEKKLLGESKIFALGTKKVGPEKQLPAPLPKVVSQESDSLPQENIPFGESDAQSFLGSPSLSQNGSEGEKKEQKKTTSPTGGSEDFRNLISGVTLQ
ncbi:MAG: AAA family ATPase [Bdellovibrionales bacterium]|nr:AAA family ATPase [Bdellovibrionales bacterium]